MKDLIERNYLSTVKRGLIGPETNVTDFLNKLDEEVQEFKESLDNPITEEATAFELADVILVCLNISHHYGIPIEQYLKTKIQINFER